MKKIFLRNKIAIILVLGFIICLPIISPYFHKGYFPTHDGEWAVVRAGEMFREMRDYQFPPRYSGVLNFGYGYPLFNFTYPFPYYLATVFHLFKFGFVDSIKIIFALSVLASFYAMFVLSSFFWKNKISGLLSATLYIYLPYRLVDLYARGSLGESMAFALYPAIFIFCLLLLQKKLVSFSIVCISALVSILVLTHNISAVYFGLIFLVFLVACIFSHNRREVFLLILACFWGGLISAFFWAPALFEKQNILLSIIPIANRNLYYVSVQQLLFSKWGYGTPTESNPFTYQLGIPQLIALVFSFPVLLGYKKIQKSVSLGFIALLIFFVLMMFPFMFFVWRLPLLSEINYPWTLLLPIGFLMVLLGGAIAKTKYGIFTSFGLIALCISMYFSWAKPEQIFDKGDYYYMTNIAPTTSSNELMPLWVKKLPVSLFENKVITQGKVEDLKYSSNNIEFRLKTAHKGLITVNQIYYPGWAVYVNAEKVPIIFTNTQGLMQIQVPQGNSYVQIKFSETPFRFGADALSVISLFALVAFFIKSILSTFMYKHKKV